MHTIKTVGLKGTSLANAQFNTIQNKVLKIGTRVEELVTRVRLYFPSSFSLKELFEKVMRNLQTASG
jgi:LEA14-like dessication related protein